MEKLKTDYLDLILLHQPFAYYYGAYRALEELYEEGIVRAIEVSNFYPDRLSDIYLFGREIILQINQVETNPLNAQVKAQENMQKYGVQIEAWAPFGKGRNNMFSNSMLKEIGDKYNKSVAQVILRWLMQRDVVSIAKSGHKERMKETFDIFDFMLNDENMDKIYKLDTNNSLFFRIVIQKWLNGSMKWLKREDSKC